MKVKIFNYDKLAEEEIHDRVRRVKALIINKNKDILIGEAFGIIQFPGGHVEDNETLNIALKREIKEEVGIKLKGDYEPFYVIKYFLKDFPNKGNNRSLEIYYFKVNTEEKYDLSKVKLDKQEKEGNFKLIYLPLNYVDKYLKLNRKKNPFNRIVNREMKLAIKRMKEI